MKRIILLVTLLFSLDANAAIYAVSSNGTPVTSPAVTTPAQAAVFAGYTGNRATVHISSHYVVSTAITVPQSSSWVFDKGGYITFSGSGSLTGLQESRPDYFGLVASDMTTPLTRAFAAVSPGGTVNLAGAVYGISGLGATPIIPVSDNTKVVGVKGVTTIKLLSTSAAPAAEVIMMGAEGTINNFSMTGVTLDGNRSTITDKATIGLNFKAGLNLDIRDSAFKNFGQNGIRSYGQRHVRIENSLFDNFVRSPIDTNPAQPYDGRTSVKINNNEIYCSSSWENGFSVLSLMGDDVEASGNKITGGQSQIVIHSGPLATPRSLGHYVLSKNILRDATGNALTINQDTNRDILVDGLSVYGAYGSGISVVGWDGTSTVNYSTRLKNIYVEDGRTDTTYTWTGEPAGIKLAGASDVIIDGYQISKPRFAGIEVTTPAKNISIGIGQVTEHQGQAPSDTDQRYGGAIALLEQGGTGFQNVSVRGADIYDYMTLWGSAPKDGYGGGLLVWGSDTLPYMFDSVTLQNNRVVKGNAPAIVATYLSNLYASNNQLQNFYGAYADINNGYAINAVIGVHSPEGIAYSSIPTTGTFSLGERVYITASSPGGIVGWTCTASGTLGTLSGVTGSIGSGSATLTVSSAANINVGDFLLVAGVTGKKRVTAISGTTITLDSVADATVSTAAVTYSPATLKTFGAVQS